MNWLTGLRETAKELHIGQKAFINFLPANHYLYRKQTWKLEPHAQHIKDGLFELKECFNFLDISFCSNRGYSRPT